MLSWFDADLLPDPSAGVAVDASWPALASPPAALLPPDESEGAGIPAARARESPVLLPALPLLAPPAAPLAPALPDAVLPAAGAPPPGCPPEADVPVCPVCPDCPPACPDWPAEEGLEAPPDGRDDPLFDPL
jgi:hypothetical protein